VSVYSCGASFGCSAKRAAGRNDVIVRVLSWPLELVNGKPLDPRITANHVDDLRMQVAPEIFTGFDPEHFPSTTLPALTLAAAAYRQDGRIGETVSLALREALEKGRQISHPDVPADVASAHGVASVDAEDDEAVWCEWHEGESRGVKGSPHFFCGDINVLCSFAGHFHRRRRVTFASGEMSNFSMHFSRIALGKVTATGMRTAPADNDPAGHEPLGRL